MKYGVLILFSLFLDLKMPVTPLKPNVILHGRYRILNKIGAGGFGITYAAEGLSLKVKVVIKEFALDLICARDSTNSTITAFDGHFYGFRLVSSAP